MPNIVKNILIFDEKDISKVQEAIGSVGTTVNFNSIKPVPKNNEKLDVAYWKLSNWGSGEPMCSGVMGNVVVFNTAWTAPLPIVEALCKKLPDVYFTYKWADEEESNCGEIVCEDGDVLYEFHAEEYSPTARAISDECWSYMFS